MSQTIATKKLAVSANDPSPEGALARVVGTPKGVLVLGGVLSVLAALVATAGIVIGAIALSRGDTTQVVWFLILWNLVALVSALFGTFGGLAGRYASGPALTLLIAAGTMFVAAVLGEPALVTSAMGRSVTWATPGGILIAPLVKGQLVLALLLGICAAGAVLLRAPARALPSLVIGGVLLAPPMAALGALGMARTRGQFMDWLSNHAVAGTILVCVGGILLAALLCVGIHKVIRAFELGIAAGLVKPGEQSGTAGASDNGDLGKKA